MTANAQSHNRVNEMPRATPPKSLITAVVFDFGGVLITSITNQLSKIAQRHSADVPTMLAVMLGPHDSGDHPWHRAERGEIEVADIQSALQPWAAEHNISLHGDEIEALMTPGQYTVIQPMLDKVGELKRRGFTTGLLTNTFAEFRPTMEQDLRFEDFTAVIESFAVGARKPEPAIYQATADLLGVSHQEILYLDDFPQNIHMAQSFGWSTIHVSDPLVAISEIDLFLDN
ncbi:MAG: HAD-IA family hydrolase [Actinobacteria bacterium]|nr:HAD-IA family hydrolase [Actinomycetota bacterium]